MTQPRAMARLRACLCLLLAACALARQQLPPVVCVAYTYTACGAPVVTAVQSGVNVLIWTAVQIIRDGNGNPVMSTSNGGPDLDCVAATYSALQAQGLPCVHLISIGGWNYPHPAVTNNPAGVYAAWKAWNEVTVPRAGFPGFDGLDWDIEGADNPSSSDNSFTAGLLDTIGARAPRHLRMRGGAMWQLGRCVCVFVCVCVSVCLRPRARSCRTSLNSRES